MTGKLYGVSVGPGDPELLTLRAKRVLESVDCIAAPDVGGSSRAALRIVEGFIGGKEVVDCPTPMGRDREASARAYDAIAERLAGLLDAGKSVAFLSLGDASVYSTWSYVHERMAARGYEAEVVPGVTSFCAAAARLGEPLCEGAEQLVVVPVSAGGAAAALDVPGTKVFMKSGRRIGELRDELRARGLDDGARLVANCGLEGEVVLRGLGEGDLPGYMSVVIVKDEEARGGQSASGGQSGLMAESAEPAEPAPTSPAFILEEYDNRIADPSAEARAAAIARWNAVAKPLGGLGVLEDDIARIAALTGSEDVSLERRAVVVLCADNGVVAQGVSQCGPEVTSAVAANLAFGRSSVSKMAQVARADVLAVDMGMATPPQVPGVIGCSVGEGTGDISYGPAMTRDQALRAIAEGVRLVEAIAANGYGIIASGEMGIGNTTTASAMSSVLLGLPVRDVVGRGAGLSDEGLERKVRAIERALQVNAPDPHDALDVLAKLGGFDIAGLVGMFIGGAIHRVPVIVDGLISAVAAYTAKLLCPRCACAMLASHVSSEPAARRLLAETGIEPAIQAGMHVGEGTGAVALLPLLDMALALYGGTTFADSGIEPYRPL